MSGSQSISSFYQEGKYEGPEKRGARAQLSEEFQLLLNLTRNEIKNLEEVINDKHGVCGSGCALGEMRPHMDHAVGTLKEVGGGSIPAAINKGRDHFKDYEEYLQNKKAMFKTTLKTVCIVGVGILLGWIGLGFWQQMKAGM